ncbi:hypothetical protein SAMD00019534_010350 [Acytostelium subglobosum LB1]|uniref:hypothetical protein n=1 Tax=Acytostelium subglobosum LB1 TaxID=1410327 RepID=UPI000644AF7C|nr:hypothetical protein SAMD00019534_010350 [Acytostelium subglobosum LB1]GAM17860.1 hypothetical protein SAMD00019534_010350 [Acytostelium subglobosum LB1]|eukprot:XP_012758456.1 hypothetical protein SAMD00019534_010350 [Acytostelium subglobosum LB1]
MQRNDGGDDESTVIAQVIADDDGGGVQSINHLRQCCVVVRVRGPEESTLRSNRSSSSLVSTFSHSFDGRTTFSCSGFIVNKEQGLILTSASIFTPFLKVRPSANGVANNSDDSLEMIKDTEIDIMCNYNKDIKHDDVATSNQLSIYKVAEERVYDPLKDWIPCRYQSMLPVHPSVIEIVDQIKSYFSVSTPRALSLVLLRATTPLVDPAVRAITFANTSVASRTGEKLTIIASPFGFISPTIFLNSVSSGILCNAIAARPYDHPSLFLTDARCLPGSEGAAVFDSHGHLVAVVTAPIRAKDDKIPFNLSPLIPSHTFITNLNLQGQIHMSSHTDQLVRNYKSSISSRIGSNSLVNSRLDQQKHSIVLVKFKDTWGSGVLISENGYILTNAHLLGPSIPSIHKSDISGAYPPSMYKNYSVDLRIDYSAMKGKETIKGHVWLQGNIEYISHTHLDIALLKIRDEDTTLFNHVDCNMLLNVKHGAEVSVLGYPLLPPTQNPPISVTNGIVSNIIFVEGMAVSYQTTAPVHSGNSGGGLFDHQGNFLGIVTCNAKQKNGSIITDLNFSIPVASLVHFFNYANGQDKHGLEVMRRTSTNKFLKALWKLQITSSPQPSTTTDGRGKKYSEFMEKMTKTPITQKEEIDQARLRSKL